jgi:hypothetical protein
MAGQLLLAWSWSTDPQLIRQQQELVQQSSPIKREREAAEKNIESASKSEIFFNPVAVISASLPERGVRILGMAAMVWFVGAFFSPIVLRYQDVLTLVSYSSIVTFVGFAVTSIMQTASGQIGFGPNLGLMIDPKSNALLFAFLNNVGPFSLWAYIATGLALAARITRPPAIGVLIGALSFVGMLGSLLLIMWLIRTGLNLIGAIA